MSVRVRVPRAIKLLSQFGVDAITPKLTNGRYTSPMVSRRVSADLRKAAIRQGTFGTFENNQGWDKAWDAAKTPHMFTLKPQRGHKRERDVND
eukprot:gene6427-12992_t